jgi:hypothetical protein
MTCLSLSPLLWSVFLQNGEDYLKHLADLRIHEIPMAPRVASLCIQWRRGVLTKNTVASLRFAPDRFGCENRPVEASDPRVLIPTQEEVLT